METLTVVLTTLKILGSLLFLALALIFRISRVFSWPLTAYLGFLGFTVLSYSSDVETLAAHRIHHPFAYAIGSLPVLAITPTLFLAFRSYARKRESEWLKSAPFWAPLGTTILGGVLILMGVLIPGTRGLLPGPGAHPASVYGWNAWHVLWLVFALFEGRRIPKTPDRQLIRRLLTGLLLHATLVVLASIALEQISLDLDFFFTPLVVILTAYVALMFILIRTPALVRSIRVPYAGSDLHEDQAADLARKAEAILTEKAHWAEPGITLARLAELVGSSPRDLSQAINQHFGVGFPGWINHFRLDRAEELLRDSTDTVTTIALRVGFGSLSSFHSAFKERTGSTPAQWRKAVKNTKNPSNS